MKNQNLSALVLSAATASSNGSDMENLSSRGAVFVVDITALSGTSPTMTVTIEGMDAVSGKYYTILASTALAAVATTVLRVYPGLTASANLIASDILPKNFRVRWTIGGTAGPTVTATVSALLVA